MSEFKIGNVVKLKSGSPEMTVQRIMGQSEDMSHKLFDEGQRRRGFKNGDIICQWFENNKPQMEVFSHESLELIRE